MPGQFYLGVDVGTGSARAAIFDANGVRAGLGTHPLQRWEPQPHFHEQSSEDIWTACGHAIRAALEQANLPAIAIRGIGFDATCSLVALDAKDRPITVSPSGDAAQNVILWMDHRAIAEATRINCTRHTALRSVGGSISPEMQAPKLLWLKEHLPDTWSRAARFLDLPDYLSYRATGSDTRSLCTTTCKWHYRAQDRRWNDDFFRTIDLEDLADPTHARIGHQVRQHGERAGDLTATAASELGLAAGTPVAISLIDAHAGGLGVLGMDLGNTGQDCPLERRMALICGSSTCHMAIAREERFVPGVWGPYFAAMIPRMWLAEGGQSATGTLIDRIVHEHPRSPELRARSKLAGVSEYETLNRHLDQMARKLPYPAQLTRHVHVYPDFHGNRSPLADPTLSGMICGLTLKTDLDALAVEYLATVQAIAHGTRHIIDTLNNHGYRIDALLACGGGTKNDLLLREHADVTGCPVILPEESEAVLLGAAMLGAVACTDQPSIESAMASMSRPGRIIEPAGGAVSEYHAKKHQIYLLMLEHQRTYMELMRE